MRLVQQSLQLLKANAGVSDPIFRVCLSLIFIVGGLGHFVEHRQMLERMAESPWTSTINSIGNPSVLLWVSGAIFVPAGVALAVRVHVERRAAGDFAAVRALVARCDRRPLRAIERLGKKAGERRLSRSAHPRKKVGVRESRRRDGVLQRR